MRGLSTGVIGVAAGTMHTCAVALMESGGVECWGQNWAGQLGDGSFAPSSVPVVVKGF